MPPDARAGFRTDLFAATEISEQRVIAQTQKDKGAIWSKWARYCATLDATPYLAGLDPQTQIDILLVFAIRYRRDEFTTRAKPREKPIGAHRISTVLCAIGERFPGMGLPDPRMLPTGKLQPRIGWLLASFAKADPAANRVWPVTITILESLWNLANTSPNPRKSATFDLCVIAFFFLCRPGEYADSRRKEEGRSSAFTLADVRFSTRQRQNLYASTCSLNDVRLAIHVALTFTDQKNCVRGETIGHGFTGDPYLCPGEAVKRRVLHLRENNAPPDTPLYTIYSTRGATRPTTVTTSQDITPLLRAAAATVEHTTGIPPAKIQAYSLRSGGATALLCAGTDPLIIQLIGRWNSDAMLRYLRTMATAVTAPLASKMLQHGRYTFIPSTSLRAACLHPQDIPVLDDDEDVTGLEAATA